MACVTPRQVSSLLSPLISPSSPANKAASSPSGSQRQRDNVYRDLLSSYTNVGWFNKPVPLSPLQCAKWGWRCQGKDTLYCKVCKVTLNFVCAFQPWQHAPYTKVCEEFGVQIQTGHLPVCPWHNRPLTDDVIFGGKVSLIYDKSVFVDTFFNLFNNFGTEKVPVIEIPGVVMKKIWPVLNVIFKSISSGNKKSELMSTSPSESQTGVTVCKGTALILSLFGWRLGTDSPLPTIHCELCLRTLGLWNFKTVKSGESLRELELVEREFDDDNLYYLDTTEIGSAKSVGKIYTPPSKISVKTTPPPSVSSKAPLQPKEDVKFGNPDIFLPMLYKEDEDSKDSKAETDSDKTCQTPTGSDVTSTPGESRECMSSPSEASHFEFKTPADPQPELSTRVLRSRSITSPASQNTRNKRKRNSVTSPPDSPRVTTAETPSPKRVTRSSGESLPETPPLPRTTRRNSRDSAKRARKTPESSPRRQTSASGECPILTLGNVEPPSKRETSDREVSSEGKLHALGDARRRSSKLEMVECVVKEVMSREPSQLNLSIGNPGKLNVAKEHNYWCPWVSTLPAYRVCNRKSLTSPGRGGFATPTSTTPNLTTPNLTTPPKPPLVRVSVVDQTDSQGWETLLHHLITDNKTPGNAWIAVHNMLQDCVSRRIS